MWKKKILEHKLSQSTMSDTGMSDSRASDTGVSESRTSDTRTSTDTRMSDSRMSDTGSPISAISEGEAAPDADVKAVEGDDEHESGDETRDQADNVEDHGIQKPHSADRGGRPDTVTLSARRPRSLPGSAGRGAAASLRGGAVPFPPRHSAHFRFTGRAGPAWSLDVTPPKIKRRHPWLEGRTGLHQKRLYVPGDAPPTPVKFETPVVKRSHAWLESRNGLHSAVVYVPGVTPLHSGITNRNLKSSNGFSALSSLRTTPSSWRTSVNTLTSAASSRKSSRATFVKDWDDSVTLPHAVNTHRPLPLTHRFNTSPSTPRKNDTLFNMLEKEWNNSVTIPNGVVYFRGNVMQDLSLNRRNQDSRRSDSFAKRSTLNHRLANGISIKDILPSKRKFSFLFARFVGCWRRRDHLGTTNFIVGEFVPSCHSGYDFFFVVSHVTLMIV